MTYHYRREDDGELIEVDFETAINQQDGFITLPDGVLARRVRVMEDGVYGQEKCATKILPVKAEIVSDALGVTEHQVQEFREDAARNGMRVDFTPDPLQPHFFQARFNTWEEKSRYMRHRKIADRNSRNGGGQVLSPEMLARAKARLLEQAGYDAR